MDNFSETLISGEILKQVSKDTRYIALSSTKDKTMYGNDNIEPGLNEKKLHYCNCYARGGLDIIAENKFYKKFYNINTYDCYWTLDIPKDATIYVGRNNLQTDKFFALEKKDLKDLPCWKDKAMCLKIVQHCARLLKYVNIDVPDTHESLSTEHVPTVLKKSIEQETCDITIETIYAAAIKEDPYALEYVPEEYQIESVCYKALKKYHWVFKHIKNPTHKMRVFAVKKDGLNLKFIDSKDQTEEIVWRAIDEDKNAIKFVAPRYVTELLCEKVVRFCGDLLEYIKAENQTEAICQLACEDRPTAIKYAAFQNDDMCIAVLRCNIGLFKYINKITPKVYDFVVERDPRIILRMKDITSDMYMNLLRYDPTILEKIENQTEEMCSLATDIDPTTIKFANIQTEEMCRKVIKNNPQTLLYCQYQPNDVIEKLVKRDGRHLKNIRPENQTDLILLYAVSSAPGSIEYAHKQSKEIVEEVVQGNGLLLKFIKDELRTHKIIRLALKNNPKALEFVDPKMHTNGMIEELLFKDGMVLEYMTNKTLKYCNLAIDNNIDSIRFVPEEYQTTEMGWKALRSDINNIAYIKKQTKKMGIYVIERDSGLLRHVKHKTLDGCIDAVMKSPYLIMDIENKTSDICLAAISKEPNIITFVGKRSHLFYFLATIVNPNAYKHISDNTRESIKQTDLYKKIEEELGKKFINQSSKTSSHFINTNNELDKRELEERTFSQSDKAHNDMCQTIQGINNCNVQEDDGYISDVSSCIDFSDYPDIDSFNMQNNEDHMPDVDSFGSKDDEDSVSYMKNNHSMFDDNYNDTYECDTRGHDKDEHDLYGYNRCGYDYL